MAPKKGLDLKGPRASTLERPPPRGSQSVVVHDDGWKIALAQTTPIHR
jgi:hypothetical protein